MAIIYWTPARCHTVERNPFCLLRLVLAEVLLWLGFPKALLYWLWDYWKRLAPVWAMTRWRRAFSVCWFPCLIWNPDVRDKTNYREWVWSLLASPREEGGEGVPHSWNVFYAARSREFRQWLSKPWSSFYLHPTLLLWQVQLTWHGSCRLKESAQWRHKGRKTSIPNVSSLNSTQRGMTWS